MDAEQMIWLESYADNQNKILDDISKLMPGADRSRISALCNDTAAAMLELDRPLIFNFSIHPDNHFSFLNMTKGNILPEITRRWRDWEKDYLLLREKYPMLELHDHIATMAPAYFCQGWPFGYDICVLQWVQHDDYDAMNNFIRPPKSGFDRRSISVEFYERMRVLHKMLGGWIVKRRFEEIGTYFIKISEADEWLLASNKSGDGWHNTKWGRKK